MLWNVDPRSEDPKLIVRVINFELVQPICPRYLNVTDGQSDRRTDGRPLIAVPRFALSALRGKKNQGRVKLLSAAGSRKVFCYFQVDNGEKCVTKNI